MNKRTSSLDAAGGRQLASQTAAARLNEAAARLNEQRLRSAHLHTIAVGIVAPACLSDPHSSDGVSDGLLLLLLLLPARLLKLDGVLELDRGVGRNRVCGLLVRQCNRRSRSDNAQIHAQMQINFVNDISSTHAAKNTSKLHVCLCLREHRGWHANDDLHLRLGGVGIGRHLREIRALSRRLCAVGCRVAVGCRCKVLVSSKHRSGYRSTTTRGQ